MSVSSCCLQGFEWEGIPMGQNGKLANNDSYIDGDNHNNAIMIVHDILGWVFPNIRLLADYYAREANATVYVPDFYGGESPLSGPILSGKWREIDVDGFMRKSTRQIREPEILDCARALRVKHKKVAAVGFCYGGWAVFRLGAKQHADFPLVDCIVAGHPMFLTKEDIDNDTVPVQLLAP
ncbi:dienelactone hydrolase family protein [Aspergillus affinis]|uniref:dienelactone hydrolase family protein n=1 Tax=Aspergillus affinis TaxID=1070780 RepID=UPI0022FDE7F0|nr:dienelactone hydrolase family protein [Aspergillus affinis]KAI9038572.1 dienelactone hydrolase family protein [Aspergillus affinis]